MKNQSGRSNSKLKAAFKNLKQQAPDLWKIVDGMSTEEIREMIQEMNQQTTLLRLFLAEAESEEPQPKPRFEWN